MKIFFCALVLTVPLLRGAATDELAWKTLTDGIADEHADKRMHAVAAFVLLKPSARTVSLVESVLEDKDVLVRQTAVETLGALKAHNSSEVEAIAGGRIAGSQLYRGPCSLGPGRS